MIIIDYFKTKGGYYTPLIGKPDINGKLLLFEIKNDSDLEKEYLSNIELVEIDDLDNLKKTIMEYAESENKICVLDIALVDKLVKDNTTKKKTYRAILGFKSPKIFVHKSIYNMYLRHILAPWENANIELTHEIKDGIYIDPLWSKIMKAAKYKIIDINGNEVDTGFSKNNLIIDLHRTNRHLSNLKLLLPIEKERINNWNDLEEIIKEYDSDNSLDVIKKSLYKDIEKINKSTLRNKRELEDDLKAILDILNLSDIQITALIDKVENYLNKY